MKKLFSLALIMMMSSGCGTIFSRSSDMISFNSDPEGAKVEINGCVMGKTPLTIPIKRDLDTPQVRIKKEGYEPKYVMLQDTLNKVSLWNLLFWPGFVIDAVTGAIKKYEVLNYDVELEPIKAS